MYDIAELFAARQKRMSGAALLS